jgi:D-arabinose 1-dehydrogenase-like Zn-dependent alcohol dehydrogenase
VVFDTIAITLPKDKVELAHKLGADVVVSEDRGKLLLPNVISRCLTRYFMNYKKEIQQALGTEEAKNLELDETPKPTRKVSNPSIPVPENAEASTKDKIKGKRLIK